MHGCLALVAVEQPVKTVALAAKAGAHNLISSEAMHAGCTGAIAMGTCVQAAAHPQILLQSMEAAV